MKVYLADGSTTNIADAAKETRQFGPLRCLISYWYFRDVDIQKWVNTFPVKPEIFADSGAFSAMTQGVTITPEQYAAWVHRWKDCFAVYSNLDVIKDAKATWENQLALESMGLRPLPCFHVLEDFSWLKQYATRYDYVGLGVAGMQRRAAQVMAWVRDCVRTTGAETRFHGFGLTSWKIMKTIPWYSVDSSSWGASFRYGIVNVFDERTGVFRKLRLGHKEDWIRYAHLVNRAGYDMREWTGGTFWPQRTRCGICTASSGTASLRNWT